MGVFDQHIIEPPKLLPPEAFMALPRAEQEEMLNTLDSIRKANARMNILRWFPDEGKYPRREYRKHTEFFRAGREYKERLFMAANRCLTYETKVETPDGEIPIGVLYERGEEFDVYAWNGEEKVITSAEAPFKKPRQAECVRLIMGDGRWVECSLDHRILTSYGWKTAGKVISYPPLIWGKIVAYYPIGVKTVYDFTVPKLHNYFAGGLVHHNSGKSLAAAYELACHLIGEYPHWWEGYRFDRPVRAWASSKTSSMTRDFVQRYLTGPWGEFGTGMIPGDCFNDKSWTPKRGIPEAVDVLRVDGKYGTSEVAFKSYDQGWESYQGTEQEVIWNDEECNTLVHNECLTRLMTTEGLYIMTFTPLQGKTEVVRSYLGDSLKITNESKHTYVVNCTWDDVPHLSEAEKQRQRERTPPHLLEAKSKGLPSVGSGAIYPVPESDITVKPFQIPEYWPRCYAMDVGWNRTAALWGALDRESDILYLYSEYYRGQAEPSVHADAIKARGAWIPGVIDPASRGRSQVDGTRLYTLYSNLGLDLMKSKNAVEAGIYDVWQRLSTGRIKVFSTLQSFFTEFRMYERDENGKVVKRDDHLMDCLRYMILSGLQRATTKSFESYHVQGYRAVDPVCGY